MSERRPNGGFFGSYLRVTIDRGTVTDWELHDAYYPGSVKKVKIDLPAPYEPLIPHLTTRFLSANQFGFTDIDAQQLIQIYEETFPDDPIRGVVFVASDAIEELLPSYTAKHREFEFINASADLIA